MISHSLIYFHGEGSAELDVKHELFIDSICKFYHLSNTGRISPKFQLVNLDNDAGQCNLWHQFSYLLPDGVICTLINDDSHRDRIISHIKETLNLMECD